MGCPEALPGADEDALAAVSALVEKGVDRIALPLPAFMPELERNIENFANRCCGISSACSNYCETARGT